MKAKPQTLAQSAGSALVWNTLFVPLKLLADVAANLIKANALSQAAFGLLAVISAMANTLGVWVDLGIDRSLPRFIPEQERQGGRAAVAQLIRSITRIKLLILIVVALIFTLYSQSFLASLAQGIATLPRLDADERGRLLSDLGRWGWLVAGGILLLVALGAFYDMLMAYLISFFRNKAWNSIALVTALLGPLLVIAAILLGGRVPGVLLAMVATPFFAVALAAWQVRSVQRSLPALDEQPTTLLPRGFVTYTAASHLLNLSDWATSVSLAQLMVLSIEQAAVLAVGFQIVRMVLSYLFTPLAGVQVPLFTRVRGGEGGSLDGAYQSICRLLLFLLVPGGIGLTLLAQPLLAAFFPKYLQAAPLVWVLAPCLFLESLLSTAQIVLMIYERYQAVLVARLLAFVSVPLLLLLTPHYGPLGAALALGLARLLARVAALYYGRRDLQLGFPLAFATRVATAGSAMALVLAPAVWALGLLPSQAAGFGAARLSYIALIALSAAVAALVFLLSLRALGGLVPEDRSRLLGMKLPLKRLLIRLL